ncbi:23S rRNA (pseudouridine(1915)-N(3))-methyltransferase RlmH [Terasakiispira papahanaumokuakeensis]|uniref:Ribosomal RNA large subunit methyltransferase H n=1 Tax=Terasakiispira papahanaumokuakeensis TaxID=197479 RepID=A0A1E2VEE7_9GAMM|nr:23S rRNA (pseudouridine(1915)-N(3))-methyltransferase RlmH [Terasakiispira papahanaumokuakeensis]ODC05369.1 23S rRNA (pseudouridine(1915)-N(3))-methyltransferase RlmH [Terasakiispira papahanaumokuakeensis]
MKIRLLAVGQRMPAWVEAGYTEYAKRLPHDFRLELDEIAPGSRLKSADIRRTVAQEGEQMLSRLKGGERVVALDVKGKPWSTEQLAQQADAWRMEGRDVALLVGGPDGLASACLDKAEQRWSLSPLTLPHPLVRVLLAEQLYRAWTLLQGHPYHR